MLDYVHVAVVGNARRLADGYIGLWRDGGRIDHERVASTAPDRMTVNREVRIFRMRPAINMNSPHPVAIDFTQQGHATRRDQDFEGVT